MTRMFSRGKTLALVVAATVLVAVSTASALDFNDIKNLIANQVSESVIQNMVRQDTSLAITDGQANELRGLGASESLVASIRRAPTSGTFADGSSYVTEGSYAAPQVVADGKPQSFTATDGVTYQLNPSTGNYYRVSPQVVVQQAPTVVYEAPRVYTTPTYVYPGYGYPAYPSYRPRSSFNFMFHFGGGGRRGWHGGGPRGHRW